ncbi:uncharacterized protein LY89DRAFT_726492 [Mollisia scopiformis]|uniref:Methyltransferase n=1 Tax=Mollisia scopiformis TaxID=149040 RepID=A0A132B2K5_MOLSC|nr:uncharacterized protein LY89DRAFT_726492 [Mollisia scopiformis]KUJ06622.1 hypothetical protein LY89DRAFT_726492 [Mollisia scopiformis]
MEISVTFLSDLQSYRIEKPYELYLPTEPSVARTNCQFTEHDKITIRDIRYEDTSKFDLNTSSFKFVKHSSSKLPTSSLFNNAENANFKLVPYLEETAALVKSQLGASHVVCFDWRYRRNSTRVKRPHVYDEPTTERNATLSPAHIAHIDESRAEGFRKLSVYLGRDELETFDLQNWRIVLINVWRPLVPVVENAPLAFCDQRTVEFNSLLDCDKVHVDHVTEGIYLLHDTEQKWYWMSRQTSSDPVLFSSWDSTTEPGGIASFGIVKAEAYIHCVHHMISASRAALGPIRNNNTIPAQIQHLTRNPATIPHGLEEAEGAPQRESIEVRSIAIIRKT